MYREARKDRYRYHYKVGKHKRRILDKLAGDFPSKDIIDFRLNIFSSKCCYCNADCKLELEHIVAISRNGDNGEHNLLGACRTCNSSKSNKDWKKWFQMQTFYCMYRELDIEIFMKEYSSIIYE